MLSGLVFIAGGVHRFALPLWLLAGGGAVLFCLSIPKLGNGVDHALRALLVFSCLAFLPVLIWPFSAWRREAIQEYAFALGPQFSVSPGNGFESYLLLVAVVSLLYAFGSFPFNREGRKQLLIFLVFVGAFFGTWSLVGNLIGQTHRGVSGSALYTFFPSATLFAVWLAAFGVVALGVFVEGLKHRQGMNSIAAPALVIIIGAISQLSTGMGFATFILGTCLWIGIRTADKRTNPAKRFVQITVLAIGTGVSLTYLGLSAGFAGVWPDAAILKSVIFVAQESPIFGMGLGSASFWLHLNGGTEGPLNTQALPGVLRIWIELGLVGVLLGGYLLYALIRSRMPFAKGKHGVYQQIAIAACMVCVLGLLVGPGISSTGFLATAICFFALAKPERKQRKVSPGFFSHRITRMGGSALILIGGIYLFAVLTKTPLQFDETTRTLRKAAGDELNTPPSSGTYQAIERFTKKRPVQGEAHFFHAQALLREGEVDAATSALDRVRFLKNDKERAKWTITEGLLWSEYFPARTRELWVKALHQAKSRGGGDARERAFHKMLASTAENPTTAEIIEGLMEDLPDLRYPYLKTLEGTELTGYLQPLLENEPALVNNANTGDLTHWFKQSMRANDFDLAGQLMEKLPSNERLQPQGEPLFLFYQGHFATAIKQVLELMGEERMPDIDLEEVGATLPRLEQEFRSERPERRQAGELLTAYYVGTGNERRAVQTIETSLSRGEADDFAIRWLAEYHLSRDDFVESWKVLEAHFPELKLD